MRKIYLLIILSICSIKALAQTEEATSSVALDKLLKLELGLHGLGLGYEVPFAEKWSVNLSGGLGGGYYLENSGNANDFNSSFIINQPVAYFRSEFKYTYNRRKRLIKSKSILHNTGNYVAFQTKYTTNRVFRSNAWEEMINPLNRTLLNEIHWGIQRPLGQKFIFNMHLGLGYATDFDFNNSQVYPAAGVQFAYILSTGVK